MIEKVDEFIDFQYKSMSESNKTHFHAGHLKVYLNPTQQGLSANDFTGNRRLQAMFNIRRILHHNKNQLVLPGQMVHIPEVIDSAMQAEAGLVIEAGLTQE